jgi:hypothetical protein
MGQHVNHLERRRENVTTPSANRRKPMVECWRAARGRRAIVIR